MGTVKKVSFALTGVAGLALGAALFIPRSACACFTPAMLFEQSFHVDPLRTDDMAARAAILRRLPVGTPADDVKSALKLLRSASVDSHYTEVARAISYHVELTSSAFGIHRQGVRLTFLFNDRNLVSDIMFDRTTRLFGDEL